MGLEGSVSKHRDRVYRPGRCDYWVKVKSREHHGPTYEELKISFSSKQDHRWPRRSEPCNSSSQIILKRLDHLEA